MPSSSRNQALAGMLAFFAGGAALAYEIVLARILALAFGGTAVAVTTVLSGYMAGLALGAGLAGRSRPERAPRFLATLQALAAAFALALPYVLRVIEAMYLAVHPHVFGWLLGRDIIRFLIALPLVLPFAIVAGAILPLLISVTGGPRKGLGASLALLYALDTLGAVAGCLGAQFLALPAVGVQATLAITACVNLACAVLALELGRARRPREQAVPATESPPVALAEDPLPLPATPPAAVLWAFGLSGFAALGYEVLATRLLSFQIGISAYAFATVVAAFLAGLAIGSALCRTYAARLRRPAEAFALVEGGIGVAGLGLLFVFHWMPGLESSLTSVLGEGTWGGIVLRRFALSFAVLIAPAVLMGMTLPLAAAALRPSRATDGRATGDAFAVNTVGAMLGSAVTGLLLLPLLGTRWSLLLLAACNFAAAVMLARTGARRHLRFALAGACLVALAGVGPFAGRLPLEWGRLGRDWRLLFLREGIGGTVTVFEHKRDGQRRLFVNGVGEVATDINSIRAFELMGHLPFALPGPRRNALVIAFGAGIALGAVASHPELERVDCVEICPPVIPTTGYFRAFNNSVLADPRVRVHLEDGRTFIAAAHGKFDLIVLDATHPTTGDSWALYTKEFYQQCLAHLAETGALVQWLPTHGLDPVDYRTALRTFISVFPNSSLWHSDTHTVLLATPGEQALDWQKMNALFRAGTAQRLLSLADIADPYELIACYLAGPEELRRLARQGPLNRDDLAPLQFGEARSSMEMTTSSNLILLARRVPGMPVMHRLPGDSEGQEVRSRLEGSLEAGVRVCRGTALALVGEWRPAVALFERAKSFNPSSRDAARWLGLARQKIQKSPNSPQAPARLQIPAQSPS
jgi:spermidine synthase